MKFRIGILLLLALLFAGACQKAPRQSGNDNTSASLPPDETENNGIIEMQPSHISDTTTWQNRIYQYKIIREADKDLPPSTEEGSGTIFLDNHIDLTITCGEKEIFHHRFTKNSFSSYLDQGFLDNGILEGLVFDRVVPEGLRFATSVSYPRSDLYIPLLVIVNHQGQVSIMKDEVLDESIDERQDNN